MNATQEFLGEKMVRLIEESVDRQFGIDRRQVPTSSPTYDSVFGPPDGDALFGRERVTEERALRERFWDVRPEFDRVFESQPAQAEPEDLVFGKASRYTEVVTVHSASAEPEPRPSYTYASRFQEADNGVPSPEFDGLFAAGNDGGTFGGHVQEEAATAPDPAWNNVFRN
jgi:hypothetical protein